MLTKYWIAHSPFGNIRNVNALLKPSTIAAKGKSKADVLKTVLVADDGSDDVELLRIMFKRSRILNPVQAADTVKDAICYLEGAGIYADCNVFPFPRSSCSTCGFGTAQASMCCAGFGCTKATRQLALWS